MGNVDISRDEISTYTRIYFPLPTNIREEQLKFTNGDSNQNFHLNIG